MDFRDKLSTRAILLAMLFFFCWSFSGGVDIAWAIKNSDKLETASSGLKNQKTNTSQQPKKQGPEEKFQKAIEAIEQIVADTVTDTDTKKNKLKGKRTEIESLDIEIKKQFAGTEKKLKNEGLPFEILDRHYKFIKHYEDNLKELKKNLDAIDKAKDKKEVAAKVEETKKFLEKVNPPKRHIPLDPNKLPHRAPEIKEFPVIEKEKADLESRNPILLASVGSLDGLLAQNTTTASTTIQSPPTAVDLAETIEIQLTPEITAKAIELGKNPVKIYEWVRNNFQYEPYYGSLKGARQTLQEMAGNDFDQASMLIALLRASNIPARYVSGTIELPIEKLMNWVGGITNPVTAAQVLATAGVPGKLLTEGGKIKYAQIEHCWVEAYVPYGNYRGALRDDSIKTWIPLDPSFKQLLPRTAFDFYAALNFNGESFLGDHIANVNSLSPYQVYSQKLKTYLDVNIPDYNLEELLGDVDGFSPSAAVSAKKYPYLLGSLPFKVIVKGMTFSSIPDNLCHKVTIQLSSGFLEEIDFSYTLSASQFINHRATISYEPATQIDVDLAKRCGDILKVPSYLIQVKGVLKIDGATVAFGKAIGLGYDQTLNITFVDPTQKSDLIQNVITAGAYAAITLIPSKVTADFSGGRMERFLANLYQVPSENVTIDDVLGEMLYNIGLSYFGQVSFQEALYASTFQILALRQPSEAIVASNVSVDYLFGAPFSVAEGGISIDVDRNLYIAISKTGDKMREKDFMIISGVTSSVWEDAILELFYDVPSVSAIKLLQLSSAQGIPIHTVDAANINQVLPLLQVSQTVKMDIQNSVNAGKKVIVPHSNIQYLDWYGTGYIILNPVTGAGAYMISNELAGGWSGAKLPTSARDVNAIYTRLCPNTRSRVLKIAAKYLDTPYRWGGKVPGKDCNPDPNIDTSDGFDCSGFVGWVYLLAGYPQLFNGCNGVSAAKQYTITNHTDYPLIADVIFYSRTNNPAKIHHVGIVSSEDVMINAPHTGAFVRYDTFWGEYKFFGYLIETCK